MHGELHKLELKDLERENRSLRDELRVRDGQIQRLLQRQDESGEHAGGFDQRSYISGGHQQLLNSPKRQYIRRKSRERVSDVEEAAIHPSQILDSMRRRDLKADNK